jgi:glycosyltransferase involved in cell wall biosynthesis
MANEQIELVHITTVPESLVFVAGQVGYMKQHGLVVHVISSPGERLDRFGQREDIPVYAVQMQRRLTPMLDMVALVRIWRHIRRIRPQIVHSHTPKGGLLGMIAAWLAGVPIRIYHVNGLPFMTEKGFRRWLLLRTERISCRLAHQVLCVSHSVRDVAIAEGICLPSKVKVLLGGSSNGVDAAVRFNSSRLSMETRERVRHENGIPADALVIGFVGRIVRDKGIVELVQAWEQLRGAFTNLHLLVVGPFEPQDPVPPNVVDRLRTDPRVHLLGYTGDTPAVYASMDIVVLPSYREGLPNVPLEAAAMGLPVVATQIPGCVDAVQEGVTGTLVPARDADSLAVALRRYLQDEVLRRNHGRAGRERVLRDFGQEAIWAAIFQEYQFWIQGSGTAEKEMNLRWGSRK